MKRQCSYTHIYWLNIARISIDNGETLNCHMTWAGLIVWDIYTVHKPEQNVILTFNKNMPYQVFSIHSSFFYKKIQHRTESSIGQPDINIFRI